MNKKAEEDYVIAQDWKEYYQFCGLMYDTLLAKDHSGEIREMCERWRNKELSAGFNFDYVPEQPEAGWPEELLVVWRALREVRSKKWHSRGEADEMDEFFRINEKCVDPDHQDWWELAATQFAKTSDDRSQMYYIMRR
jgi:hypothetical protein